VAQRADFGQVRYAQSWEDPENLRGALAPDASSTILSIAAAGDNSFALLLQGAGRVVSVDMSPAQCALVELKRAAIRTLEHEELLRFVGATPSQERRHTYARVRAELPDDARTFWDAQPELIAAGVIHVGKLEHMFRIFRTRVHPLIHGRRTTRAAFDARTRLARERFWHERWNNRRWRLTTRMFFSEAVIGRLGRDPSFFEHVQLDVGRHYAERAWHAFVELDPSRNPFLQYILLGRYLDLSTGHPWLAPEHHAALRERLDDLEVVCSELETYLHECEPGTFTGFNLSDIFEWMSDDLHEQVYRSIVQAAAPGASLAYWNNLVPRSAPASLVEAGAVRTDRELARRLHDADRSFLYRDFHVDSVIDPEVAGR
jgi:S-adenosylmethionine-diacylglycerol 3-amino-3-carboxypropyl transferase